MLISIRYSGFIDLLPLRTQTWSHFTYFFPLPHVKRDGSSQNEGLLHETNLPKPPLNFKKPRNLLTAICITTFCLFFQKNGDSISFHFASSFHASRIQFCDSHGCTIKSNNEMKYRRAVEFQLILCFITTPSWFLQSKSTWALYGFSIEEAQGGCATRLSSS